MLFCDHSSRHLILIPPGIKVPLDDMKGQDVVIREASPDHDTYTRTLDLGLETFWEMFLSPPMPDTDSTIHMMDTIA